ncbi:MAG TPA: O-antigen ligase family protein [Solirubrobacteraceae bacterium]|nr:O-antigen ligase family protein [Solirubrobacteraceae bacterium]
MPEAVGSAPTGSPTRAAGLRQSLREAPTTLPALLAIALFVLWSTDQAGYPLTHWAPGALVLEILLAIALLAVPPRLAELPRPVKLAWICLAAYTALSFCSIIWAAVPGDAWEGANRTLLYLLVFSLFALWPQNGTAATLLLAVWTLATIVLAAFVALHVNAAASSPARLADLLPGGRLTYPSSYANANAAQWLIAFWPALLLVRERRLPWPLRGVLAGGAVLLADVALLSVSRGSLYATPVMLVLVFALLPARVRTFAALVPVAAGIAVSTPFLLRVNDRLEHEHPAAAAIHTATAVSFAAALLVAVLVALAALAESRISRSAGTDRTVHRGIAALALATLAVVLLGGLVAAGNPVSRARHAWDTFKSPRGYAANSTGNRLTSGLGSSRYDFYRVALDEFAAHPVLGIGADNFAEPYLAHRHSEETPHYPHSVELRTLSQTGLLGALLALAGLAGALLAGWRALRAADPLARAAAAAALAGFAYWLVHGSFDWFWEFAGLGAPAFALLGIACALAPRAGAGGEPAAPNARARPVLALAASAVGLAIAASFALPWLSQLQIESAARIWPHAPATAYSRLDDAARLNPLSDEADLVAGSIALRFGDDGRAESYFAKALQRTPGDAYATLELGAIASARGERGRALALLARALRLNPRDPLTRETFEIARHGKRVDIDELNRLILSNAQRFK